MSKTAKVTWEQEGNISVVVVDNPPANALSSAVAEGLLACFKEIEQREEIRCVVLRGAGERFFMAGAEITELTGTQYTTPGLVMNYIDFFPGPVIAAVEGMALGGGCELMLCCDICIAGEKAFFGLPEAKLGLMPGGGGTQRLPRRVGECKAKELIFLGDFIPAAEALQIGLINKVVPAGEALNEAKKMAHRIAAQPAVSMRLIKQSVDRGLEMPLLEGMKLEAELFQHSFRTEDAREGVNAFLQKREPDFKHR